MLESCAYLRHQAPDVLADILTSLITRTRAVLVDPETSCLDKVLAMYAIVDAVAPPPPPDLPLPAGRGGQGGSGAGEALVLTAGTAVAHSPAPSS
jgi:hypothetical protein